MVVEGRTTQDELESIPFKIIKDDNPHYRCCAFRERAIVRERLRLACGLDLLERGAHELRLPDINKIITPESIISEPLVNVIKIGCEKCPEDSVVVTDLCRNCLAHPCVLVCPVNAVSIIDGRSTINQEKCIKCLRCTNVCPYEAITRRGRPCAQACGVDAIFSDPDGFAEIDQEKCVDCGLCTVSCPFGAIADKTEIVQVLTALEQKIEINAIVAPSFVSQFGRKVSPGAIFKALHQVGFHDVREVALGADVDIIIEAGKLAGIIKKEDVERSFLGTSCCPSWVLTARNHFPELERNISESYTPMVETAREFKEERPAGSKVVFIGPCIAKKHESLQAPMADFVDFVLTFEEMAAIFVAMGIDLMEIETASSGQTIDDASELGRGFPVAGGVSDAISVYAERVHGIKPVEIAKADTLRECRKLLSSIKGGKIQPDLVEGMACPDGCIGGPGTLAPLKTAHRAVVAFREEASKDMPARKMEP